MPKHTQSAERARSGSGLAPDQDFEIRLGERGLTIFFSVAGKKLLWNGLTGDLESSPSDDQARLLEEVFVAGGLTREVRQHWQRRRGRAFVDEQAIRWLDGPAPRNLTCVPSVTLRPRTFIVYPAAGCNMTCSYCSNSGGTFGSERGLLSMENAARFVALVRERRSEHDGPVQVTLIGGEPTLNPGVCQYLACALLSLNDKGGPAVHVRMSTNGLRVAESLIDVFSRYPDHALFGFSLDGGKERNDRLRRDHRFQGTFERSFSSIRRVASRGVPYEVTAVVGFPFEFVEVFEELRGLDLRAIEIKCRVEAMNGFQADDPRRAHDHIETWRKPYIRYNQHILGELKKGDLGVKTERPVIVRRILGATAGDHLACDAGTSLIALAADGGLYACDRFFPDSSSRLGDVASGLDAKKSRAFLRVLRARGDIMNRRKECRACFARNTCRGGCYAENFHRNRRIDSILVSQCDLHREKLKIDLYSSARLAEEFPERFAKVMGHA